MIEVCLENGSQEFGSGISALAIVESLGDQGKGIVGFRSVDEGDIYDLHSILTGHISVKPIKKGSEYHLIILRQDAANVLSKSIKEIYEDDAEIIETGVLENGFYLEFYSENPVSQNDFEKIEKQMNVITGKSTAISKSVYSKEEALEIFDQEDNSFARGFISLLGEEPINICSIGDYKVVCSKACGNNTKNVGNNYKLVSISGVSSKYDYQNVQRIVGTFWHNKQDLKKYLDELEENAKWDHRNICKNMDICFVDHDVSNGMINWLPNGTKVINKMKTFIREMWDKYGYSEVQTPVLMASDLWKKSGHEEMFKENMMFVNLDKLTYALKPMSCPAHINMFKFRNRSYRDLPFRLAEFGYCHRYEPSGSLYGLMRTRAFTQDDAHVFCMEDQITDVIVSFCEMLKEIYRKFGFEELKVKLSTRPEKYIGNDDSWSEAESALQEAANKCDLECEINPGEGAFYGPKLEFSICDKRKHVWQCGTVQVDFSLAERLGATYTDSDSSQKTPIIVHHAALGSLERFLGILIENTKGLLPAWVHPAPFVVLPLVKEAEDFSKQIKKILKGLDLECLEDYDHSEKLGYRIRKYIEKRVPNLIVIGKKEMEKGLVTLRDIEGNQEQLSLEDLVIKLKGKNEE